MNSLKVLLAEDEEHIAKLLLFKLGKEGFSITWASDGQRALEQSLTREWDLIILDVMMPIQDGWQVLKEVRKFSKTVPVLMLSAKGSTGDVAMSEELGATRFLKKPFDPTHLASVVHEMTSKNEEALANASDFSEALEEFIDSFDVRRKSLISSISSLAALSELEQVPSKTSFEVKVIAHNIAGVAGSYGFPVLGSIAAGIDNQLVSEVSLSKLLIYGERLVAALDYCLHSRQDCTESYFTSSEEFPAFEATP